MKKNHLNTNQVMQYADNLVKGTVTSNSDITVVDQRGKSQTTRLEDNKSQFIKRADAFVNGASLLIDNLSIHDMQTPDEAFNKSTHNELKAWIGNLQTEFEHDISAVTNTEDAKRYFAQFLAKINALIESKTKFNAKTVERHLNNAERLSAWSHGRTPLITVSKQETQNHGDLIIVQAEIPRCKLTKQQINEYLSIANESAIAPLWFKNLEKWEQRYLRDKLKNANEDNINDILLSIPSSTRYIPGLANYTEHVMVSYKLDKQGNYIKVQESHRERSAVIAPIDLVQSHMQNERQRLTENNVTQLLQASLGDRAKAFAETWSQDGKLGLTPSNPISVPVTFQTLLSPGVVTTAMANILGPSDNNEKMIKNKKVALQKLRTALATPNSPSSQAYFKLLGLEVENGAIKVNSSDGETYWVRPNIISTNHAVNIFRRLPDVKGMVKGLFGNKPSANNSNAYVLLNSVGQFLGNAINYYSAQGKKTSTLCVLKAGLMTLSEIHTMSNDKRKQLLARIQDVIADLSANEQDEQTKKVIMLLSAVKDYIETPLMSPMNRHRPLFLSSLEQIITEQCGGVGYGSCKSGKDRKGMEVLHTDAMLAYHTIYGEFPRYNDSPSKRDNFTKIFADLFKSNHQQEAAAQNAPGASGIKELKFILCKDLQVAVGNTMLAESNLLGSLNKVSATLKDKEKEAFLVEMGIQKPAKKFSTRIIGLFNRVKVTISDFKTQISNGFSRPE